MRATVMNEPAAAPLLRTETPLRMAKADLRKAEMWRERIGQAVERARLLRGWSLKELADHVGRDERQIARWIAGTERPQWDALFAVESLRGPFVIALAEVAGDIEVTTHITLRRTA